MNPDNPMPKSTHKNPNLPSAPPFGSAKPCKQNCPKCGAVTGNISREYRTKGEEVDKHDLDDECKAKPPFLSGNWPYGYKASKEHISHHCRVCSYEWQSDVLPNTERSEPPATDV